MLTKSGAKLLDFGIAAVRKDDVAADAETAARTGNATIIGTPYYMAPEQIEGRPVDARTDIFAFGALLYEMLSGRRAFDASTATGAMAAILKDQPAPLIGVAPAVERIVRKCLSKDPHDRYSTAAALADDLGRFLSGEPVAVRPSGAAERLMKWARRKPTLAAAYSLGLLTVLLVGFGATAAWLWQRAERNWHDAADARFAPAQAADEARPAGHGTKLKR